MDLVHQEAIYPTDQAVQPPDTQVAAGPAELAEAVNSTLSIWTKAGTLTTTADLNAFFSVPVGYSFSDPRIFYDAASSRWFLSGLSFNKLGAGETYLAVSTTADPTGSWNKYLLGSAPDMLLDQPMIGASIDKLVISWNDFTGAATPTPTYVGEETWVLQKSDLLAGAVAAKATFGPDTTRFRIVPAISTSATTTEWLAYAHAHCSGCGPGVSAVGAVAISGTPATADVTWTETDLHSPTLNDPPPPRQPSGIPVTTEIGDHFTSAVWQNGVLWMSGNDACMPNGDTAARACLRLVKVATATPAVAADFDVGFAGFDLHYPAVAMDQSGNLFVAYSESSPTLFPSAMELQTPAGNPTQVVKPTQIAMGQTSYLLGLKNRWGDYSAAAVDPVDPTIVWTSAEYQASASNPGDWGTATYAARMPLRLPAEQASPLPLPTRSPAPQSSPRPSATPR